MSRTLISALSWTTTRSRKLSCRLFQRWKTNPQQFASSLVFLRWILHRGVPGLHDEQGFAAAALRRPAPREGPALEPTSLWEGGRVPVDSDTFCSCLRCNLFRFSCVCLFKQQHMCLCTVERDTVASNCSTGSRLSNFNNRINSNNWNWDIWVRWGFPTVSSPDPSLEQTTSDCIHHAHDHAVCTLYITLFLTCVFLYWDQINQHVCLLFQSSCYVYVIQY